MLKEIHLAGSVTVSLTIEIPRGVYELAVRNQVALKDEPGCETLND
jgi:hypothetical protein